MAPEEIYRNFHDTGQEDKRLRLAVEGYFREDASPPHKEEYRIYLKKRIRRAVEVLLEGQDEGRIMTLAGEGFLTSADLDHVLAQTHDPENPSAFLKLLHIREKIRQNSKMIPGQLQAGNKKFEMDFREIPVSHEEYVDKAKIMKKIRNQIYALFPFLDGAIASLPIVKEERKTARAAGFFPGSTDVFDSKKTDGIYDISGDKAGSDFTDASGSDLLPGIRTNGIKIYYSPEWVYQKWKKDPCILRRGYLHILLHCLYFHVWDSAEAEDSQCDAKVEEIIENECRRKPSLREWLGNGYAQSMPERIVFDDHSTWPRNIREKQDASHMHHWERLSSGAGEGGGGIAGHFGMGASPGTLSEEAGQLEKSTSDYRNFLQPFAIPKEETELDPESFDYIYYSLGMSQYGNMPLIEPLEYREGHKLEELVIAIDTSGSCSLPMVRSFLEETWAILDEKENFFHKMNVWVVQCDCVIQDVVHIRSREDWMNYIRELRIEGRAGTDFRPVFRFVEDLKKQGKLTRLKGLIYFTDGDGIYPREEPDYETAFVFLEEKRESVQVPSWARMLKVDPRRRNL